MRLLANDRATPTSRVIRVGLGGAPFTYRAGQSAAVGVPGVELTPYSIASAPSDTAQHGWLEFLVKVDGSSRFGAIVSDLAAGLPLVVSDPTGSFTLPDRPPASSYLFVAGGTGIAPLRSMIRELIEQDNASAIELLYAARSPEEFAFAEEFRALERAGRLSLSLTLTGDAPDWPHLRGRPGDTHLARLLRRDTLAFLCGPNGMVADVAGGLEGLGVAPDRIRAETWAGGSV
ncbi:MAG: ferredoxin--NADP reductase [Vicinamibacterales bacterium]